VTAVTGESRRAPGDPRADQSRFREDIQGLRAVAVSLVLVYHVWPDRLAGGYVGVDVFFVISGFLITAHLLNHPPRGARDLAEFWGRRIRRLLPAALLVLAATAVAARLVAPSTQWRSIAVEVIASALYVQNWVLANTSVDYLAAANVPTPTQHFWSLSVEEQFYLFWPVVILGVFWLARRSGVRSITLAQLAMLAIIVGSLTLSVVATSAEPASAYFVTPTRVWELAVGGFLATLTPLSARGLAPGIPAAVAFAGVVMVVVAGAIFSGATAFPGYAALLPVMGTALVIHAASRHRVSPTRLFSLPAVQHLGDISYSVYLWHWPLIVLAPYVTGRVGWVDAVVIIAASVIFATLTKVFVEDRFRFAGSLQGLVPTYRFAAAGMIAVTALAGVQLVEVQVRAREAMAQVASVELSKDGCLGAAAIARGFDVCPQDPAGPMIPEPALAKDDRPDAYADDCWANAPYTGRKTCTYGAGPIRIALVGNSHAGEWLPTLQVLAKQHGWTITTFLVSQCNATDAPLQFDTQGKTANCLAYGRWVLQQTAGAKFDLVVTSERQSVTVQSTTFDTTLDAAVRGYESYLAAWSQAGTNVLVLRDSPDPGRTLKSVPDCLAEHPKDQDACAGTPTSWYWMDPLEQAARNLSAPGIRTVDMLRYFCTQTRCPAVIGSVVTYFDASHMTATYARTLAPYLDEPISAALRDRTGAGS
jgi:peptidoglycan/LPS O-acetylase OafA/YrhL